MESISRAIGVAAMLGTGITLVLALVLFLWPVQIMDLLSNKHELSVLGAPYLKLIGFSYVFNMLSSIYVSAMRSAENPGFGMKLFGVSTLLNTGMNYLLIFGKCGLPALGIQGAAIATLLSRVAEFLICLVCALRSRILPLDLAAFFRPGWEMLRRFVKYSTPVILNETAWGLGNSLLTVILGHTTVSVAYLAADAVAGNLNRLFLVVCFGLGAATAVMIGKAIGEGQSHDELMDLSRTLSWVTILVGAALAVIALALVPLLFQPVVFPLFKLYDLSAHLATTLAVTGFACIPFHAYSISAVTGILRAGGDVFWSTALDLAPQWLVALPLTALLALVLWRPLKAARRRRMEYRKTIMEKLDRIIDDVADLQYERLSQAHDFYTTRGWCPTSKKDQLCRMYKSYTSKGRNHLSAHYEQDILSLPETPAEKEEK